MKRIRRSSPQNTVVWLALAAGSRSVKNSLSLICSTLPVLVLIVPLFALVACAQKAVTKPSDLLPLPTGPAPDRTNELSLEGCDARGVGNERPRR